MEFGNSKSLRGGRLCGAGFPEPARTVVAVSAGRVTGIRGGGGWNPDFESSQNPLFLAAVLWTVFAPYLSHFLFRHHTVRFVFRIFGCQGNCGHIFGRSHIILMEKFVLQKTYFSTQSLLHTCVFVAIHMFEIP